MSEQHAPKRPSVQTSRLITIASILGIAAVIAVVLFTSERNGPGSEQYSSAAAPAATTAPAGLSEGDEQALAATSATSAPAANNTATGCVATKTMPGGDNFYTPNAPQVESLGTGLVVQGTVRRAGTCEPVGNARIQIWLNTERGGEGDPSNRGSVLTDENGHYQLSTVPVRAQFGQPHVHIAYDDAAYESLFLRSVMDSETMPVFTVDFVLEPSDEG